MRAIAGHYGVREAVERGLAAGVDQFLCCHTAALVHEAIEHVIHAVERGTLSRAALAEANRRIAAFAERYAQPPLPARPDLSVLGCAEHAALIERVSRGAEQAMSDPTERGLG